MFKLDLSHPKIQVHIDQANSAAGQKVFSSFPPASILFKDFSTRAHRVSLDNYRGVFGKEVMSKNLVSVEAMVKSHDEEWEYSRALNRFFQGQFSVLRPVGLPQDLAQAMANVNDIPPMLKSAREEIVSSAADYEQKLQAFNNLEILIIEAFQTRALLDAGFHLSNGDVDAMDSTFEKVEQGQRLAILEELNHFENLVRDRLTGALQLLDHKTVADRIENGEDLKQMAATFVRTANVLENQLSAVRDLQIAYQQLAVLVNQLEGNEDNEKLVRQVRLKMEDLRKILARLKSLLSGTTYPFEHTEARMTLGDFAITNVPGKDELRPLLEVAYEAVDKIFRVYARLVGRLAQIAELVENGLGLPPLPEPPQAES